MLVLEYDRDTAAPRMPLLIGATVDRTENTVLGAAVDWKMKLEENGLLTGDRVSEPVRLAVLIKNVPPELRSAVEMHLGAAGATYRTVNSAWRTQIMAAAEYDRDGTIQAGGGLADMDIGEVN